MTTPTTLAETIAHWSAKREGLVKDEKTYRYFAVPFADMDTLLTCARRCEAMARVSELSAEINESRALGGAWGNVPQVTLQILLDAAADRERLQGERDALAKRVGELEADNERYGDRVLELKRENERLTAESTRLRAENDETGRIYVVALDEINRLRSENERLAETAKELLDIRERLQLKAEARAFVAEESLRAAQDRVRALDLANDELRTAAEDEARNGDILHAETETLRTRVRELERELGLLVGKEPDAWARAEGPIADPTQGVVTLAPFECRHVLRDARGQCVSCGGWAPLTPPEGE